jgi:hypothetical protein
VRAAGRGHHRRREDVWRLALDSRGQRECPVRVLARRHKNLGDRRRAAGHRAGLVQDRRPDQAEAFEHRAVLDHDTASGCRGHAAGDRDGHGEKQWARGGGHQHGHRTHRVPGPPPAGTGERERDRHEHYREPVGEPRDRCDFGEGLLRQPHDTRVRARLGGAHCPHGHGGAGVAHPAPHDGVLLADHGKRLARQRGLVEGTGFE